MASLCPPHAIYPYSEALKSASFSCWALMKASLKRLASAKPCVSHCILCPIFRVVLTLAVGETDGERLSFGLAFADVGGRVPNPAAVAAYVGRQLHVRDNYDNLS